MRIRCKNVADSTGIGLPTRTDHQYLARANLINGPLLRVIATTSVIRRDPPEALSVAGPC